MEAKVKGGGLGGQLDAVKYGIARALKKQDPAHRVVLKRGSPWLPFCSGCLG